LNVNVNLNEFFFYSHELAGTPKKIFQKKKMLPDCNPARQGRILSDLN